MALSYKHEGEGNGSPLVLVHGTGGSWEAWASVIHLLAPQREVFAIDLPGFGASAPLPAQQAPSVPALADAVARWMAEQGLERPHVAGNSLGGGIALELARSSRVRSATALSPVGFWNRWEFAYSAASLRMTRVGARLMGPVAPLLLGNPVGRTLALGQVLGRPWRLPAGAAVRGSRAMVAAPAFKAVIKAAKGYHFVGPDPTDVPVTIAWGKCDRLLFPRQGKRAKQILPDAHFLKLSGCGHVPMTDDPELIAKVLLEGSETPVGQQPPTVSP